jgi:hypothetical protein
MVIPPSSSPSTTRLIFLPLLFFKFDLDKRKFFKALFEFPVGTRTNGLPGDFKKSRGILFSKSKYAWNRLQRCINKRGNTKTAHI